MVGIQPVKAHSQLLVDPVLQQNLCFRLVPKLLAIGHGFPTLQANEKHLKYDKIYCTEVQSCLLCLSIEIVVFLSLSLLCICMHAQNGPIQICECVNMSNRYVICMCI